MIVFQGGMAQKVKSKDQSKSDAYQRVRADHAAELAEDYVELIADLIAEQGEARGTALAKRLGVANPTVAKVLKRLQSEGLIVQKPYRAVFLTEAGEQLARNGRRRHEIVEAFLQQLGVRSEQARIDAEGIEHHVSVETLQAMEGFLRHKRRS